MGLAYKIVFFVFLLKLGNIFPWASRMLYWFVLSIGTGVTLWAMLAIFVLAYVMVRRWIISILIVVPLFLLGFGKLISKRITSWYRMHYT